MYYIVEKPYQLDYLISHSDEECFINVITLNDFYHPALTKCSLIYFRPLTDKKGYMLCIDHSESFGLLYSDVLKLLEKYKKIYVLDKKFHLYFLPNQNLIDVNFNLLNTNKTIINDNEYNTVSHNILYNKHQNLIDVDKIIPISKHYEKWENIYNNIQKYCIEGVKEHISTVLFNIEKNGIKTDSNQFNDHHKLNFDAFSIKEKRVFTCYNLYNVTTRPTNSFNGINFMALPKESRGAFIPSNDFLIDIDYKEYHPRLIADLIGYNINKSTSIYEELSKVFNSTIEEAKKITFRQFYGGIEERYLNIEYFNKINQYITQQWEEYKKNSYITLSGGKKTYVEEPNKSKIFNYIIQSLETSTNIETLIKLLPLLDNKKTKIIHYTYDSLLLDVAKSDGQGLLEDIKNLLSEKFPVKISYGENYKDMHKLDIF